MKPRRMIITLLSIGSTLTASTKPETDVIVYGGTPCGIAASIMAAREGANVCLIEPTRHVGGLATSGLNTAETEHMLEWTIGGFSREFYERLGRHYRGEPADNDHLPYQLYVREGRRMRGRYVVRQQDVQTERRKPDRIGISSHFIDSHHVQRLAVSATGFVNEGRIWRKGRAYQIPYRSPTPLADECANLLVPGAASFTHVAYCTLRLESVWMITGHAAGVAAAMASKAGSTVQDLPVGPLQEKTAGARPGDRFHPRQARGLRTPPRPAGILRNSLPDDVVMTFDQAELMRVTNLFPGDFFARGQIDDLRIPPVWIGDPDR